MSANSFCNKTKENPLDLLHECKTCPHPPTPSPNFGRRGVNFTRPSPKLGRAIAKRLKIHLYRQGIPIFDRNGHTRFPKVGYRGTIQLLFDIANLFLEKEEALVEHYSGA